MVSAPNAEKFTRPADTAPLASPSPCDAFLIRIPDIQTITHPHPICYGLPIISAIPYSWALYTEFSVLAQALVPAAVGRAIDAGIIARDQRALTLWGGAVVALGVLQAAAGNLRDRAALLGDALAETARGSGAIVAITVVAVIRLHTSWQLGIVVLLGVPLMAGAIALLIRPLHRRQRRLREQQAELTGRPSTSSAGLRVLRGIGGEDVFAGRYRADSQRVRAAGVAVARVEALLDGAKLLLPGLLTTVVVWLGAHYVVTGRIGAGQLVAFYVESAKAVAQGAHGELLTDVRYRAVVARSG
ncbi:ABC transporter transmembrane domain-containing protein [Streptomyces sp. NPDC005393]|uniref:ABC transporter transmembrane domain-containing protein n=1 Tax=Streptomyces sp. NPDC005393 TaxID=3157041 RepID=UPI0033B8811E